MLLELAVAFNLMKMQLLGPNCILQSERFFFKKRRDINGEHLDLGRHSVGLTRRGDEFGPLQVGLNADIIRAEGSTY